MKTVFLAASLVLATMLPVFAADMPPDMPPPPANTISNEDFVRMASVTNKFEIDSSRLALTKAKTASVKTFAQRMIDDHEKTGQKMAATLANSKLKPETTLDEKHQLMLKKLEDAPAGDEFENEYLSMQIAAHDEAVKLFDAYSSEAKDKDLRAFANETLPALKEHQAHVKKLKN